MDLEQKKQPCWKLELEPLDKPDSSWLFYALQLLRRVFDLIREDDLEIITDRPRTAMMSPRLLAEGTQTTVCLNFAHLCRTMHRKPGHVMNFLLGQMETKGSLDKQQRLEMQGLVSSKDFQAVFRRYIVGESCLTCIRWVLDAFVICSCCKSPGTALGEDNGLFTLRCEMEKDEEI
ncbi:unnamed protein product [Arabis nemorensis]|uniref:Translation initiation factor IF2/IF5 domain-containing protein n=1 Tax=Arabis nemorensis TaxID=586526 RepID=A0A565CGK5_9BRAS|nr:unnamed protein product [Arabis nemorensis]